MICNDRYTITGSYLSRERCGNRLHKSASCRSRRSRGRRFFRMMSFLGTRSLAAVIFTVAALMVGRRADAEPTVLPQPVSYSDGAVAQARAECGVGDLCGNIKLPDEDEVRVYNRGATRCGPFTLELVTLHGDAVVLRSKVLTATRPGRTRTCPQFENTYVTLDSGVIRMGVFLAKNGSLFVEFLPGTR
jgi:hypothetical protein